MSGNVLAGKTAVITGGAQGLGFAIAERYVAEGARVVLGDLNLDATQEAVEKLGGADVAAAVKCDVVSADDIDAGMVEGCNHPMGPLRLADLIGLDTTMAVADSLYAEFKEPLYASPPLLSRMVEAGLLGRKTGRGFYDYQAGR